MYSMEDYCDYIMIKEIQAWFAEHVLIRKSQRWGMEGIGLYLCFKDL